ncbi:MAG: hypothetical protein ACT4TC_02175 [Myxococcaceae bacterium]
MLLLRSLQHVLQALLLREEPAHRRVVLFAQVLAILCSSQRRWKTGNRGDETMNPGTPCVACHEKRSGTKFAFAGTVYATLHEEEDCYGISDGGTVEVTDKNGKVFSAPINEAGNFMLFVEAGPVAYPARVKVIQNGQSRPMVTEIAHGDCNLCHSELGTSGAPGRVLIP